MHVAVMQIREMRVLVHQDHLPVAVRLAGRIAGAVGVPVVLVVHVSVLVLQLVVAMLVLMRLGQVEIDPTAIRIAAMMSGTVTASPSAATAITAPMNGAVEK